jgi:DNA-binding MarR family transcriptional regulator
MSLDAVDPVIHAPKRLAAMAILANSAAASFSFLRDHLGISDSDLSKQMAALERAGYVRVSKTRGPGGSTSFRITRSGAAAYQRHLAALRAIVDGAGSTAAGESG